MKLKEVEIKDRDYGVSVLQNALWACGLPLDYAQVVLITRVSKLLSEKYDQATLMDTTELKSIWMTEFAEMEDELNK